MSHPFRRDCGGRGAALGGAVTPECEQRKTVAVQVVANHEAGSQLPPFVDAGAALFPDAVAGKPAAGERLLVPGAVGPLPLEQEARPAMRRPRIGAPRGDEAEQRPRRLRRRAFAPPARLDVDVGGAGLTPASVGILPLVQPT